MPASHSPPLVLTFAGFDPTGGAGIQADVLTIAALGCHPLCAVTALTVQDTRGVQRVQAVEPEWVAQQARSLLAEMRVSCFKLGLLGSVANVAAVGAVLAERPTVPVVVDPVLASGRGDSLAQDGVLEALRETILPRATIVTPNSLEARRLGSSPSLEACARALLELGCRHVLITGTHEQGTDVRNVLYGSKGVVREDRWPRLPGSYHGSGCTLASALAALLARGLSVEDAAQQAQAFTWRALQAAFKPGGGQWLPDRLAARDEQE